MHGNGSRLRGQLAVEGISMGLAHVNLVERARSEALEEALHLTVATTIVGLECLPKDAVSIALEGAYGNGVCEGMCTPVPALRQVKHKGGIGQVHNALVLTNELIKTMMHIGTLDGGKSHLVKSISTVGIAAYRLVASMRTIGKSVGELLERRMQFEIGSVVSHKVSRRGDEGHLPISVAELEGRMQLADGLEFICPKDEVAIGRYDCVSHGARGNLVLERIVNIITEIEA